VDSSGATQTLSGVVLLLARIPRGADAVLRIVRQRSGAKELRRGALGAGSGRRRVRDEKGKLRASMKARRK
jgi:hypothetical protein